MTPRLFLILLLSLLVTGLLAWLLSLWKGNPITRGVDYMAGILNEFFALRITYTWLMVVFIVHPIIEYIDWNADFELIPQILLFGVVFWLGLEFWIAFPFPKVNKLLGSRKALRIMIYTTIGLVIGYHIHYLTSVFPYPRPTFLTEHLRHYDLDITFLDGLGYLRMTFVSYVVAMIVAFVQWIRKRSAASPAADVAGI